MRDLPQVSVRKDSSGQVSVRNTYSGECETYERLLFVESDVCEAETVSPFHVLAGHDEFIEMKGLVIL